MPARVHEDQTYNKKMMSELSLGVVQEDTVREIEPGRIMALRLTPRGELKVSVDSDINLTSTTEAQVNASAPGYAEGSLQPLSMGLNADLRTRIDRAQGTHDDPAPAEIVMTGGYAETTVPTAVADGDAVRDWKDGYGRAIGFADVLSSQSRAVTLVAAPPRATFGPITHTQLTAPGDTAAVNVAPYKTVIYAVTVASIDTNVIVEVKGSVDGTSFGVVPLHNEMHEVTGSAVAASRHTITANGTYLIVLEATALQETKFTWVSEAGGTAATIDVVVRAAN